MRILQTQRASTEPYRSHVVELPSRRTRLEKLLHRFVPEPILSGFELFWRRNHYDVVVTAHYRTSLIFGILSKLLGRKSLHLVKELYLDESVRASAFARSVFRWALSECDGVVTNCSAEIAAYGEFLGLPPDRFHYLPWPANIPVSAETDDEGYIFSAGRSFRDWHVLFDAAARVDAPFVVVAEAQAVAGLEKPANVTLRCDVARCEYLELLRKAHVVVVPLCPTVRSIGQATILEAMALGKPVLTARTPGVADYVTHEVNGLYYEAGDCDSLVAQLTRLRTDPHCRQTISRGGIRAIQTTFNKRRYAERMVALLRDLLARRWAPRPTTTIVVEGRVESRHTDRGLAPRVPTAEVKR